MVFWDAEVGIMSKQDYYTLSPCHLEHQYLLVDQSYKVMAMYCKTNDKGDIAAGSCDQYTRTIDVSQYWLIVALHILYV